MRCKRDGSPILCHDHRRVFIWTILVFALGSVASYYKDVGKELVDRWRKSGDLFRVSFHSQMTCKYPGPMVLFYDSYLGKTVSPISVALYFEVANAQSKLTRIQDYTIR